MKRELTDQETDSVTGGYYVDCDSQQNEKLNKGVCPFCGAVLTNGESSRSYIIIKECGTCQKSYRLKSDGQWWMDDLTKKKGC